MKILQINAVYKHLSTGSNVYELNHAMRTQGHQAVAAYSVGAVELPGEEYLIGSFTGQKMHALLSRITGLQGYFSSHSTRKLLRYIDSYAPDVVVLNNLHANYIHLPMLLKYLAKKDIPTVAVLHDCWFYTGKCCYYTTAECEKWKTGCQNCPAKKKYNKSWFFDRTPKMYADRKKLFSAIPRLGVVAVSDWLLEQAKQSPIFQNASFITRIHNWIDTDVFAPADAGALRKKLGLENKKIMLAVAAIWEKRKGLDTITWIAERLGEDEALIVIGGMESKRKLPERVICIPRTNSREELIAYYSMADVFLQPSLEETFGKVTAEAIACGTPVVCYDSTANPELVGPGCGAVVPVGDREGMLRQARSIIGQGKLQYSAGCRAFALNVFDKQKIFRQYGDAFARVQSRKLEQGERNRTMKILWVLNMVMPDAAKELGIKTSFSGSWMIDPLQAMSCDDTFENATFTYGHVDKPKVIAVNGVKHYIFPGAGKRLLFSTKKTLEDARYVLEDFQPDLIHIYGTEYSMGHAITKLKPKVPILLTIQGILTYISKEYRGGLPAWTYHRLATIKQIVRLKLPVLSELLFKKNAVRERYVVQNNRYITGRTAHDRAFVMAQNPNAQYFKLNYNLRQEFYQAEKWDLAKCNRHTIFTGAATYPLKGLHNLLEAVALVKKRYPDVKVFVPGNQVQYKKCNGYERYLHKKIKQLQIQENIEFIGRKTAEEMITYLQTSHVYAFPSAYDTDSLSLCEAHLLGIPCVVSVRGGSGELIQDRHSGLCYNYGDTALLAEKICQLFENDALCQELSENACKQASRRHDREKNIEEQKKLYDYLYRENSI